MIDVHCHLLAPDHDELLGTLGLQPRPGAPSPPQIRDADGCWTRLGEDGWAVVSPPPFSFRHDLDAELTARYAAGLNDQTVALVAGRSRAAVLAWLPLQHPDVALAELERVLAHDAVVGLTVATPPAGRALGGPELDPVWEAVAAADLGVFVHPDGNPVQGVGADLKPSVLGFPTATTAALLDLLTSESALWSAGVRLCAAHGGGFLAAAGSRAQHALDPAAAATFAARLQTLWVDSVVFDDRWLDFLRAQLGPDRVLLGTDWPFPLSLTTDELRAQDAAAHRDAFADAAAWCPRLGALLRR